MIIADLQSGLLEAAAWGSVAIALVLVLRQPVRRAFGSGATYLLWVLVPLSMLAAMLPAVAVLPAFHEPVVASSSAATAFTSVATQWGAPAKASGVMTIWMIGALLMALVCVRRQMQFVKAMGVLTTNENGLAVAQSCEGLPAVIGVLRPRVVLPADYLTRFDPRQQQLVLAHEQAHIACGDQISNLLALVLRCFFWFNPFAWWAALRFRQDQELACDARVMLRHPQARRSYGEALLRTQLPVLTAPLSCQMGFAHPLRERIAMITKPLPDARTRGAGIAVVILVGSTAGLLANAAQEVPDVPAHVRWMSSGSHYPAEANARQMSGKVVLEVSYDATGSITAVIVGKSEPAGVFEESALARIRGLQIQPAVKNGAAVGGKVIVPIVFRWEPGRQ